MMFRLQSACAWGVASLYVDIDVCIASGADIREVIELHSIDVMKFPATTIFI